MSEIDQNIENIRGNVNAPVIDGDHNTAIFGDQIIQYGESQEHLSVKQTVIGKTKNFVGRTIFINKIKKLMTESDEPIAVVGEAGLGKSELAYEIVTQVKNQFSNVILFDFTNFRNYEKFLTDFAIYLNLSLNAFDKLDNEKKFYVILDILSQLKHVLIYVDNFETISNTMKSDDQNANDARLITHVLESVPNNTIVFLTSRNPAGLDDQRLVNLEGLSQSEGIEMFVKLAKIFPNPSKIMLNLIGNISEKTGGHPLSIELLARSYKKNGIPELEQMLKHLGTEIQNNKNPNEKLRSLKKCFRLSIDALEQNLAKMLPKLTLFSSAFTPQGAHDILDIDHDALQEYYDHGLLRRIDFDEHNPLDFRLYWFHPATKNYLQNLLNLESLKQDVAIPFIEYYVDLARFTSESLSGPFRVPSVNRFKIIMHGENDFDKASMLNESGGLTIYYEIGETLLRLGNVTGALKYAKKGVEIAEKQNDEQSLSIWYNNIATALDNIGDFQGALEYAKKALMIDEKNNDELNISIRYSNISQILHSQGDLDAALDYAKKSLNLTEKNHDHDKLSIRYSNISQILHSQGDLDAALDYEKKSLKLAKKNKDEETITRAYNHIGRISATNGDLDGALEYAKKALNLAEKNEDDVGLSSCYSSLSQILHSQNNLDEALKYAKKGLMINKKNNDELLMASSYHVIGSLFESMGIFSEAMKYYDDSLKILNTSQEQVNIVSLYINMGLLSIKMGNIEDSLSLFLKAEGIVDDFGHSGKIHPFSESIKTILSKIRNADQT